MSRTIQGAPALPRQISPQARRFLAPDPFDGGHKITRVQAVVTRGRVVTRVDAAYVINGTEMKVVLPAALGPGQKAVVEIDWHFIMPETSRNGRGARELVKDGWMYEVAQWFPRAAVYDDQNGWQTDQFYGQGEFYLNFGTYDVELTVPHDHIVQATTLNNTTGVDVNVPFTVVFAGDKIDFALDPKGVDGLFGDGSDSSTFTAAIFTGMPPQGTVADSVADWSAAGTQGANGWFYGFYNETDDADAAYDPNSDFSTTDPNWSFAGGNWVLGEAGNPNANPPWDTIGQTDWHPNGSNQSQGVHWVIKRWVSDVDGDLHANVQFGKANTGGGRHRHSERRSIPR